MVGKIYVVFWAYVFIEQKKEGEFSIFPRQNTIFLEYPFEFVIPVILATL